MDLGLEGMTALVTGAGGGVGAAIARALCSENVRTFFTDIDGSAAARAAEGLGEYGIARECDVTKRELVEGLFKDVEERYGNLQILVNCAALNSGGYIEDIRDEEIAALLDVNVKGYVYTTIAAVPLMRKAGYGRLIYINSGSGLKASAGLSLYSASKYFNRGFAVAAALELGRFNITANSICPSDIYPSSAGSGAVPAGSWMNDSLVRVSLEKEGVATLDELIKKRTGANPMRRACTLDDVANLALFLASRRAGFINGQSIGLNGGAHPS